MATESSSLKVCLNVATALKIVQHCQAGLPAVTTGHILGFDANGVLDATDCFPALADEEVEDESAALDYQLQMLRQLRDVNADANVVGWYCSSWLESHLQAGVLAAQYQYQRDLGSNTVLLLYDPLRTTRGALALRACRLSQAGIQLCQGEGDEFNADNLQRQNIAFADVFEELPVEVVGSQLSTFFLRQLTSTPEYQSVATQDNEHALGSSAYLATTLTGMADATDELVQSHWRERRPRRWDERQEPRALLGWQVSSHCSNVDTTSASTLEELFLAQSLHETRHPPLSAVA